MVDAVVHPATMGVVDWSTRGIPSIKPLSTARCGGRVPFVGCGACDGRQSGDGTARVERQHALEVEAGVDGRHEQRLGALSGTFNQLGLAKNRAGFCESSFL